MIGHLADGLAIIGILLVGAGLTLAIGLGWGLVGAGLLVLGAAVITGLATG